MTTTRKIIPLIICLILVSSFSRSDKYGEELAKLIKLEQSVLKKNVIGKIYTYDLTHIKNCNKSEIKYLGVVKTKKGNRYKILNSFFVFTTGEDMCHGTSNIKIYDMKNRYIGKYYVSMPVSLPDTLIQNKLIYLENWEECNLRKTGIIDLGNGLPKSFFIPCSKNGGDIYTFE